VIGSTNRGFAPAKCRIILRDVRDFKRAAALFLQQVLVILAGALPGNRIAGMRGANSDPRAGGCAVSSR